MAMTYKSKYETWMIQMKRRQTIMLSDEIQKVEIDEQRLNRIKKLIITAERENIKTGEFTTQEMVKAIRKIIERNAE